MSSSDRGEEDYVMVPEGESREGEEECVIVLDRKRSVRGGIAA